VNQRSEYAAANSKRKGYSIGDKVLLSTKNLRLPVPKKKLGPKFVGPFRILDAVGMQAYRLALPKQYRVHNVFHVSLLEPWSGRDGEEPTEPMPLVEEDGEYEVEAILDTKVQKKERYYLVKWKDWPEDYNIWEPEANCEHAQGLIDEFWKQKKGKRKR